MFRVQFPGPYSHHDVVVNGWKVPLLHAHPCGNHDQTITLVLDNRLALSLTVDEAERFVPFLADVVAVALGYTAHPDDDADEAPMRLPHPRPVRAHSFATDI